MLAALQGPRIGLTAQAPLPSTAVGDYNVTDSQQQKEQTQNLNIKICFFAVPVDTKSKY